MLKSIIGTIFLRLVENLRLPAMTEIGLAASPLRAARLQDTATTERHWKSCGAVLMVHTMLVPNCTEQFAALDSIWGMTVSLLTHWNLRAALLSKQQDSALMDKLAENNGQDLGAEITISARRK